MALMSTRRTTHAQTIVSRQLNGNLATKFSRTFVAQMEALSKHRRGGKQIVEHVHVNEGGQAVIANTVNTGGGSEIPKTYVQSHASSPSGSGRTSEDLRSEDEGRASVPLLGDA